MNSIKCSRCGTFNLQTDILCRRCGRANGYTAPRGPVSPRDAAKRSTWAYTLLIIALICGGAYYLYSGFMRSFEQVQTVGSENYKPATDQPRPAISRTQSDQQRTTPFRNAVQNSQGLTQAGKHNADMEKLMQPAR